MTGGVLNLQMEQSVLDGEISCRLSPSLYFGLFQSV